MKRKEVRRSPITKARLEKASRTALTFDETCEQINELLTIRRLTPHQKVLYGQLESRLDGFAQEKTLIKASSLAARIPFGRSIEIG